MLLLIHLQRKLIRILNLLLIFWNFQRYPIPIPKVTAHSHSRLLNSLRLSGNLLEAYLIQCLQDESTNLLDTKIMLKVCSFHAFQLTFGANKGRMLNFVDNLAHACLIFWSVIFFAISPRLVFLYPTISARSRFRGVDWAASHPPF